MTLVEPKPSPRPWFALWRREAGSFAQLPLLARGIFAEVLKLTDDDGVIDIGAREPAAAIAWALGADRADRRALEKYVPMLLADGCLRHEGQRLIASSFARWQPTAKRPRTSNEPTTNEHVAVTNEQRNDHEPTTIAPRTDHETEAKPAEPFTFDPHSRVEESRGEKKEPPLPPPDQARGVPKRRLRDPMVAVTDDPAVIEVHAAWKAACNFETHRFNGAWDPDAGIIAKAIDAYGIADCILVANHAPNDGMVSGKRDERGAKHDTIRYIFGNADAFNRILRAANEAAGKSRRKRSARELHEEALRR